MSSTAIREDPVARRGYMAGLVLAGLFAILGSFMVWAICPYTACVDGQTYSGVDLGYGAVSAILGGILAALGAANHIMATARVGRLVGVLAAVAIVAVAAHYLLAFHVTSAPPFGGPGLGFVIVATCGVVALGICGWADAFRPPDRTRLAAASEHPRP